MTQRLVWNFEFSPKKSLFSLLNPADEASELKWEIRYFWPEERIISLYAIDDSLLDLANYQQKHKEDIYFLLPHNNYNIKRRRDELLYKPVFDQSNNAIGFGTKINLEAVSTSPGHKPEYIQFLQKLMQQVQNEGTEVRVKKESFVYKFATNPVIKLELARFEVKNRVFFSACIEGKSLYLVESIAEHLLDKQISCEYVTFLKSIIKS